MFKKITIAAILAVLAFA